MEGEYNIYEERKNEGEKKKKVHARRFLLWVLHRSNHDTTKFHAIFLSSHKKKINHPTNPAFLLLKEERERERKIYLPFGLDSACNRLQLMPPPLRFGVCPFPLPLIVFSTPPSLTLTFLDGDSPSSRGSMFS